MNKYFKNFILCSDADQYCLLCKEMFHLVVELEKHIRWERHRKNVKALTISKKFPNDSIYKLEEYFYCESCNIVAYSLAEITEHIDSEKHKVVKSNPNMKLKRPNGTKRGGYVIIGKVIINKLHWNTIVDNKCHVCDVDVDNYVEHIELHDHILKMMQCDTSFDQTNHRYYRKITNNKFQCFTCKSVFMAFNFEEHLESCIIRTRMAFEQLINDETLKQHSKGLNNEQLKKKIVENELLKTMEDFYTLDKANNKAVCKGCDKAIEVSFKDMLIHMKDNHRQANLIYENTSESSEDEVVYQEVVDHGKKRSELSKYGKKHNIKLNHNGGKGYCTLCNKYMSAHKTTFREHCRGRIHRGHLEMLGQKRPKRREDPKYDVTKITHYLTKVIYTPELLIVMLNYELRMDVRSFFLIYEIPKNPHYLKTKCFACDELINHGEEEDHCVTPKHVNNFVNANILVRTDEFIREVRPNLYHCGFCNRVFPFADALEIHLQTRSHNKMKTDLIQINNMVKSFESYLPTNVTYDTTDKAWYVRLVSFVYAKLE